MSSLVENVILNGVRLHFPPFAVGKPAANPATLLHYMLLVLKTGMAWRHLAETKCPYNYRTVHRTFQNWSRAGVFHTAYRNILKLYRRKRRPKYHCIDSSYVKNLYGVDCVGRNPTDRGRKATKLSAIVDDNGVPIALTLFPANHSDFGTVADTLSATLEAPMGGLPIYADKGYDSAKVRSQLSNAGYVERVAKRRHVGHRILNRKRGIVERFFSWLDKHRRLLMRYDSYVCNYASWTWLACCRLISNRVSKVSDSF